MGVGAYPDAVACAPARNPHRLTRRGANECTLGANECTLGANECTLGANECTLGDEDPLILVGEGFRLHAGDA
ncbi:MAG: hypothetical protein DI577_08545 [Microbacterium sp.]|nr:MAG: hypothetical protein DI577_08545 [Microbacterium sp.]PZU34391.1 MAG: hypothetical protein DI575_08545 [Microbacterium sp.]